ncbi:hypothetical protein ScPMuIL_009922 [Solemya velum]
MVDTSPFRRRAPLTLPQIQEGPRQESGLHYITDTNNTHQKQEKPKNTSLHDNRKPSNFDHQYSILGSKLQPERKRIDIVLVHPKLSSKMEKDQDDRRELEYKENMRERFEEALRREGFLIQVDSIEDDVYKKLHCPFRRLCVEAEKVKMEMPLKGLMIKEEEPKGFLEKFVKDKFITDIDVDFVSAPFMMKRIHWYHNYENMTDFFSPSIRSLLVHHILINLDIRTEEEKLNVERDDDDMFSCSCSCLGGADTPAEGVTDMALQKVGLPYLLMKEIYTDFLILHETSAKSKLHDDDAQGDDEVEPELDPRKDLDDTWTRFFKFQPLWKIRNYFGEKIAFYYAWSGMLITSLWLPMVFGFIIFIYGLVNRLVITVLLVKGLFSSIKESFDNEITPFFAVVICVWGTVFLEFWKRKTATLAYLWDVDEFESNEPDRPEFFGTKYMQDPVTKEDDWFYPWKMRLVKFLLSAITLLFMVCLVLASVVGVIVYRVIASVDYCPNMSTEECLLTTTVASSLLNAISILLLGKLYDIFAKKLTDWENHRTQTQYDDALIIKLFAFQFANNYASCFYIAFFRGRFDFSAILDKGVVYKDDCEGTCMSQLSFQVLTLMITKPLPKLFSDVILPFAKMLWRKLKKKFSKNQIDGSIPSNMPRYITFLEREVQKEKVGDLTLEEYTEKIIQYGFLVLFAASFPLAPLFAFLTNLIDIRVDAKRLLWWYRRPVAVIAQDIGTWFVILQFLNFCGVVSNGFLIAFTSSWGDKYSLTTKLWIVIGFEHIVFILKFILSYAIPDVPSNIRLALRKKTHQLNTLLEEDRKNFPHIGQKQFTDSQPRVQTFNERRDADIEPNAKNDWAYHVLEEDHGGEDSMEFTPIRKMKRRRKAPPDQAVITLTPRYEQYEAPPGSLSTQTETIPPTTPSWEKPR